MIVSLKKISREVIEDKKSKTLRTRKIQQNMFFAARGRDISMVMPHPLWGSQMKGEIQGFLLMYRLFVY